MSAAEWEQVSVDVNLDVHGEEPVLICQECGETICSVEHGDNFAVLARTVDSHFLTAEQHQ